ISFSYYLFSLQLKISCTIGSSQESQPQPPSGLGIPNLRSFLRIAAGFLPIFSAIAESGTAWFTRFSLLRFVLARSLLDFFGFSMGTMSLILSCVKLGLEGS